MMKQQRRITKDYFMWACRQYAPLIQKLAIRISIDNAQVDELKARAPEELLKCMICYRRSGSFMTFLYGRLSGVFRHLRDAEYRAKRIPAMSLDAMSGIAGPDCDIDTHLMAEELIGCLTAEEQHIITESFFEGKTMREISTDDNGVPSTICRIRNRAIRKMKQKCGIERE